MLDTVSSHWSSLLTSARAGDEDALNEVWRQLRDYLHLTAADVGDGLQGKLDASDIVQQSLLEAHIDFSNFRGQSEREIRAWLIQIVRNNLVDAGRRFHGTQRRAVSREIPLDHDEAIDCVAGSEKTASSLVRRKEDDDQLLRAIAGLPERGQQVLRLRHQRRLSHAEIAHELGMTVQAARKLWSRTIEELRQRLMSNHDRSHS